jgi:carbon-monoxide dehydrogenase medium subunit
MKPAPFAYHAPSTIDEALELLGRGDEGRVLAGGQSLVPLMKLRAVRPKSIIDINKIAGLGAIEVQAGQLHLGALVRQQHLIDHEGVSQAHPLIREAGRHAGYLATRHRGTVGGSLAYAAPWAELSAAVVALDASVEVRSARGTRQVPARSFFRGPHETALEADELVTGVTVPAAPPRTGSGFHEVSVRYRDYAQVAAAATVTFDGSGACTAAELVLLRVAPTPLRADIGAIVRGTALADDVLDEVGVALAGLTPPDDIEASGTHRHRVAVTLARRALRDARDRATDWRDAA